jgi:signal peptidase II
MKKSYLYSIMAVVLGILLDQYTKLLAVKHLMDAPIPIIDGVFELHYLENRGAAFGIMQNQQTFFLIAGVVILSLATWAFIKLPEIKRLIPIRICIVLICAGAIGNMIDRVRLNYVIDFLYFKLINFPIFNVADIYVTLAAFGLVLLILFYYSDEEIDSLYQKIGWKMK